MVSKQLAVVGTGIKSVAHFTLEAQSYIRASNKVFYLVHEPILKEYILSLNASAENLDVVYNATDLRSQNYSLIAQKVLDAFTDYEKITLVIYGHPTVMAQPAVEAIHEARKDNIDVRVIPGISAEDYLFADLAIDPGRHGWSCYEATEFLIRQRRIDPYAHLILWQIGVIGLRGVAKSARVTAPEKLSLLQKRLLAYYPTTHNLVVYEGSAYPSVASQLEHITLNELERISVSPISTLYVPPLPLPEVSDEMLQAVVGTMSQAAK